jgi:hypothetical protein
MDEQRSVSERDERSEQQRGKRGDKGDKGERRERREREEKGERSVSVVEARSEPQGYGDAHKPDGDPTAATNPLQLHLRGGLTAESDISQTQGQAPVQTSTPTQTQTPSINVTTASPRSSTSAENSLLHPRRSSLHAPATADQDPDCFLVKRLASEDIKPIADMDKLQVRSSEFSTVKTKAIEDARQMQARVIEECTKTGKDPPPYGLVELIGKGSFGRVYMG